MKDKREHGKEMRLGLSVIWKLIEILLKGSTLGGYCVRSLEQGVWIEKWKPIRKNFPPKALGSHRIVEKLRLLLPLDVFPAFLFLPRALSG